MTFIQNLIRTLPENISARRIVLQAAFEALPAEHPDRLEINSILAMLESHETARLKFAGKQKETANEFKPRRREEHGELQTQNLRALRASVVKKIATRKS